MEVYVFPAVKHPPCSAQNPGPSQEVIVSLSTEPWSCLGDSECFQSLPSWPVISGDDLGHRAHRQKIQLRNCYRSTCEWGGGTPAQPLWDPFPFQTTVLSDSEKICLVTALVEGVIR